MKKVFLFLPVLAFLFSSCIGKELTKEASESIYAHESTLNQKALKDKLLQFISEKFRSGKEVIQVNEEKLISGNANIEISQSFLIKTSMEYTFIVKIDSNNYKTKYVVKNIFNTDTKQTYDVHPSNWGNYEKEIKNTFNNLDRMMSDYISSDITDF